MNHPQFFIDQKVIYKNMPNDPLTVLTITDIKGMFITAVLPGGTRITSEASSFQKFVPKDEAEENSEKPKKPNWSQKKKFFKKKNSNSFERV